MDPRKSFPWPSLDLTTIPQTVSSYIFGFGRVRIASSIGALHGICMQLKCIGCFQFQLGNFAAHGPHQ